MTFEEIIKYFLKKWKLFVAIVLVSTVLFAGAMYLFYETVAKDESYLREYYNAQVELYEAVLENGETERADQLFFDDMNMNVYLLYHLREEARIAPYAYMETVTVKSAVVFGAAIGCVLAVSVVFSMYVKSVRIENEEME